MRRTHELTGLRTAVVALGLVIASTSAAQASALVNYSTSGSIDSTGVTGAGVISFIPVANSNFTAPSQFSLGEFQVAGLLGTQTTTYDNTPFHITYLVNSVDGTAPSPNETPIQISGVLNGSITGGSQSSVEATFDPIGTPTFLTGDIQNTLTIKNNSLDLVPSTTSGGRTTAQARLDIAPGTPSNTPEPTSIALFVTALGGLGLRQRLLRNKQRMT